MVSDKNISKKNTLLNALISLGNDLIGNISCSETQKHIFSQLIERYKKLCSEPLVIKKKATRTSDVLTNIKVMKSHVESELEPITTKLRQQKKMKKTLEEKIEKLESLSLQQAKSLEKFVSAEDFNLSPEDYSRFPQKIIPLLDEALNSYKNGNYFACCSVCGTLFEGIIKKACEDNNMPYKGLAEGIKSLKIGRIVASKELTDNILNLSKWLRDKSAHWTKVEFDKDEARIALSSLNILREKLEK